MPQPSSPLVRLQGVLCLAPNFSFGSRSLRWSFRLSTRPASAPFQVGQEPYPAGYGFPLPCGCRPSLLGSSCSRWGVGPPLRLADWEIDPSQTPSGFPRSALWRCDWGGCSLYPGAVASAPWAFGYPWASPVSTKSPRPDGSTRPCQPPFRSFLRDEASTGSSFQSSRCPFGPGDWTALRLCRPGFARGRYRPRTLGWGWAYRRSPRRDSASRHSVRATSCRTQ